MAYSSLWCTLNACLQVPVLHRDVSVYKSFCLHLRCLPTVYSLCCTYTYPSIRDLCCTWKCLSSRACAALVHVCLRELCAAPVLVCLPEFCAAPGTCLPTRVLVSACCGFFRNRFVCFSCFDPSSKHRNKSKNIFLGFTKQTEKQPKQNVFQFFSVQSENIFRLFRGHPS